MLCSLVILAKTAYDNMSRPPHLKYTEDIIYSLKWRWSWDGISDKGIKDLNPYCQNCDSELAYAPAGALHTSFYCKRCDETPGTLLGGIKAIKNSTISEIHRLIRTGEAYSRKPKTTLKQSVRTKS